MTLKEFKKDVTVVMNEIGRYSNRNSCGYDGDYNNLKEKKKICFEIDPGHKVYCDEINFTLDQAALAIVINNSVKIKWYYNSRGGTGANFETDEIKVSDWIELAEKFKTDHPELNQKNWANYLDEGWENDYSDLED